MKRLLLIVALVAAAPPATDWTRTVRVKPDGAHVMGKPGARVAIVEYVSYSCPGCAAFTATVLPTVKRDHLRRGTATIELRHFIQNRYDLAAAILARCDGPARMFGHSDALFAAQKPLMTAALAHDAKAGDDAQPIATRLLNMARGSGLIAFMQRRGLPPARAARCLADERALSTLIAMTEEAEARGVPHTPALYVNDRLAGNTLPALTAAILAETKGPTR